MFNTLPTSCDNCGIFVQPQNIIWHEGYSLCCQGCVEKLKEKQKNNPFFAGKSIADIMSALNERFG